MEAIENLVSVISKASEQFNNKNLFLNHLYILKNYIFSINSVL